MSDQDDKFEEKLPSRITGLVFWGLVLIGLFAAVIMLRNTAAELKKQQNINSRVIAYDIENIVEQYPDKPAIEVAAGRIRLKVDSLKTKLQFNAISLQEGDKTLLIGVAHKRDDIYSRTIHYYPAASTTAHTIKLEVYYTGAAITVNNIRKKILLSVGFGVFIFGLLLQWVLQKMLSAPFQQMVKTARDFSEGKETVRFDDSRQDEFGFLAGFINNAVDTLLAGKKELLNALDRAALSEQKLSIQKEYAEVTLHSITDSVITVDKQEFITYINPAAEALLLVRAQNITGKPFNQIFNIVNENTLKQMDAPLHRCFTEKQIIHLPEHSSLFIEDGSLISIEASVAPMKSDKNELIGAVMIIQDVSHTRRLTRQLSYQASHDLLTGLYNRRKFEEHLEEVLQNVIPENSFHSLFYLDLDNFKIVNDTCGHVAGDELLKQLPTLFNDVLRSGDVIARLGGDEFGIILENCNLKQAKIIADKIRQIIKDYRFVWDDKTFDIGVSIGVVGINADNADMATILSSADIACYAAKDFGRNRVHVYEASDEVVAERFGQMHWTARITHAMEHNRFRLFRQPIIRISGKACQHEEILIRMLGDNDEIIPPGAFLPAAERYGLMPEIDRWVIKEAFRYMGGNSADSPSGCERVLTINLSGDSINDDTLLDYILKQKEISNISLSSICFEVTETVAISNLSKATKFINKLKQYGCQFALDDFGSGLSSFAYLKTLPVNYLKIDGGFIRDISHDNIDRAMVESIQQVGRAMKLETIAEHVENAATLVVLKDIGVDYVQGFHLGRPQAIDLVYEERTVDAFS